MKTYIHYGHKSFDKDLFTKIANEELMTKPTGGLWASDVKAKYGWKDWCKSEHFRDCDKSNSFTFVLSGDAKMLQINCVDDLLDLPKMQNKYSSYVSWILLDFEKISQNYDAIQVNISNDYNLYHKLYGWDCDSILVMKPDVVIVK